MNNLNIRYATNNDYVKVQHIMKQLHDLHVELRPDIYRSNDIIMSQSEFEECVKNKTFIVAELENQVVGILKYSIKHKENPSYVTRTTLYIHTIAVDENMKGKGIGGTLLDFIKKVRKENHYDSIELKVNALNQSAIQMYKKNGFVEESIIMELI